MIRALICLALYLGMGYMLLKFVNRLLVNFGRSPLTGAKSLFRLPNRNSKNVIDLCPRCGALKEFHHRCR